MAPMRAGVNSEVRRQRVEALGRLAHLLDDAFVIPGTRLRVGLDPIIGLVPWLGDLLTALFSGAILLEAFHLRAPLVILGRMTLNVLLDLLVGAVPFLGDLFDAAFKANVRNLELLKRHVGEGRPPSSRDYLVVGGFLLLIALAAILPLLLLVLLLQALGRPLF